MVKQPKVVQFMFQNQIGNKKGVSIIEILAVISIITITLTSLLGLISFSFGFSNLIKQTIQANNIAQEAIEIVRNFRDGTNWNLDGLGTVATGDSNPYHLEKSGSPAQWLLIPGIETINSFSRKIVFDNVMRDGNGNIVASGGFDDPDTKKVTVIISWQEKGRIHNVSLITCLTNWKQ